MGSFSFFPFYFPMNLSISKKITTTIIIIIMKMKQNVGISANPAATYWFPEKI